MIQGRERRTAGNASWGQLSMRGRYARTHEAERIRASDEAGLPSKRPKALDLVGSDLGLVHL